MTLPNGRTLEPIEARPEMSSRGWEACSKRLGARKSCRIDGPHCTGEGWRVAVTFLREPTRSYSAPTMGELVKLVEGDL